MITNNKFLTVTAAVLLCLQPTLKAQMRLDTEPQRPSTDAWSMAHYGEISPSLFTGTAQVRIPFYQYSDPDFDIPIAFRYSSSGCVPNVRAGVLGQGWTLEAGGSITREIRGIPDDMDIPSQYGDILGFYRTHQRDYQGSYTLHNVAATFFDTVFYKDASNGNRYDAGPDIFHFNIPGHSGSFMLDMGGKIHVYNTSGNDQSYQVAVHFFDGSNNGIVITAPDGNRYEFDSIPTSPSNLDVGDAYTITAWHLSRIVAPNGRTVSFSYSREPVRSVRPYSFAHLIASTGNYNGTVVYNGTNGAIADLSSSVSQNAFLSSITIDGGASVEFTYENIFIERYYTLAAPYGEETSISNLAASRDLKSIRVKYDGQVKKGCDFSYTQGTSGAKSFFLTGMSVSGEGDYSFAYHDLFYPYYGTFEIDHWGFYNGVSTGNFMMNISSLDQNLNETIQSDNRREPNATQTLHGMLTQINYPAGGKSVLAYEPHTYSYSCRRTSSGSFVQDVVVENSEKTTGGLRIASITDYDRDGITMLGRREYQYAGSGILLDPPRYFIQYQISYYGNTTYHRLWSNNLTKYANAHVEYANVEEKRLDGSEIHYSFTNSLDSDYMDFTNNTYSEYREYQTNSLYIVSSQNINRIVEPNSTRTNLRGRLELLEKKDTLGQTVSYERNDFNYTIPVTQYASCPVYVIGAFATQKTYVGQEKIGHKQTATLYGAATVPTDEDLTYNSYGQCISSGITGSSNIQQITRWTYVSDYATAPASNMYRKMYDAGQIDRPVTEAVYTKASGGSETLVSSRTLTYLQPDAVNHPTLFCVASVSEHDQGTDKDFVTSYAYDKYGRVLQKTDPVGITTTYVWGYNGLYPVAEIVGATLTQVKAVSGLSGIETAPLSGALTAAQVTALRDISDAEVTSWEYAPLVGLTKETTPDGRSTTYTYNASGKLHQVLDDLGRKTAAYLYSPDNKQQ